jgi:hypothetical protein
MPQDLPRLEDCTFYHVIDLPVVGTQGGPTSWDLRGRFDEYIGSVPLAGKTVLDVGAASGFLTFEAERRGATVTSFDADSPDKFQYVPYPDIDKVKAAQEVWFRTIRNSYWLSHHLLKSRAELVTGDIYQIGRAVSPHDISIVGQILVHLRDPLEALRQVALITRETMIIVEGSFESNAPTSVFVGGNNYHSFWHLSDELYRQYLPLLGFEAVTISKADYRCNDRRLRQDMTVWTFIAKRIESTRAAE